MADPTVLAIVAWLGLFATIGGFGIALRQLRKIKSASDAAAAAAGSVMLLVKERSSLTDLVSAIGHVESIKIYIQNSNFGGAQIYGDLLRGRLIGIQNSIELDKGEAKALQKFLIFLHTINEQLIEADKSGNAELDDAGMIRNLNLLADWLNGHISRLRLDDEALRQREE